MAILRGGRRVFGTDIRFGIPRDRSLDNVQGDPRLKRTQGNPESTIGRFQAKMAEGEGFATPNRFMVDFILPKGSHLYDRTVPLLGVTVNLSLPHS